MRSFLNLAGAAVLIYLVATVGRGIGDMVQLNGFYERYPDAQIMGKISRELLAQESGIDGRVCVIDDSIESKRCQLILVTMNKDEHVLMPYVQDHNALHIRVGTWPFARIVEFERIALLSPAN